MFIVKLHFIPGSNGSPPFYALCNVETDDNVPNRQMRVSVVLSNGNEAYRGSSCHDYAWSTECALTNPAGDGLNWRYVLSVELGVSPALVWGGRRASDGQWAEAGRLPLVKETDSKGTLRKMFDALSAIELRNGNEEGWCTVDDTLDTMTICDDPSTDFVLVDIVDESEHNIKMYFDKVLRNYALRRKEQWEMGVPS